MQFTGAGDPSALLMPYLLDGYFANGGRTAYIVRTVSGFTPGSTPPTPASVDAFNQTDAIVAANIGDWATRINVLRVVSSDDGTDGNGNNRFRIVVRYQELQNDTWIVEEDWDRLSTDPNDENYVVDVLARSRFIRWAGTVQTISNFDLLGNQPTPAQLRDDSIGAALTAAASDIGTARLDTAASAVINAYLALLDKTVDASLIVNALSFMFEASNGDSVTLTNLFTTYAENRPLLDLFHVAAVPRLNTETDPSSAAAGFAPGGTSSLAASTYVGAYWPWVEVSDPVGAGSRPTQFVPPTGHVLGIMARTDGRRGVWKAPAGVEATVNGIVNVDYEVGDLEQDSLNPRGINAIRPVPTAGVVVWGSRTVVPASEWRYVPVRRTAIFLRRSIYNSIQWAVFEPNDEPLWQALRQTISAFMETQFRNGAFAGRTSNDAYFVKCDSETTTEANQVAGIVNVLVGFAPLRPAEFVIVQLSQKAGSTSA